MPAKNEKQQEKNYNKIKTVKIFFTGYNLRILLVQLVCSVEVVILFADQESG